MVHNGVDTTDDGLGTLNLNEVDGLLNTGGGEQARSVGSTAASGDDLTSSTMDGVGMELYHRSGCDKNQEHSNGKAYSDIKDVDSDTSHVLLGANTLPCSPLEGGDARILDFVQVLHPLGDIDQQIRAGGIGTETPDLPGIGDIPSELISHNPSTSLEIVTGADLAVLDGEGEFLFDGQGFQIQTIVLVLGLGEGDYGGLNLNGFTVTNDGVRDLEGDTSVVFLEILGEN